MQVDLFAPVELKDICRDLNYWKGTANKMARNYPTHQYAVVEDVVMYVCQSLQNLIGKLFIRLRAGYAASNTR